MGSGLGMALGALNVLVVATAFGLGEGGPAAVLILAFGLVPGIVVGSALGWIGDLLAKQSPFVRWPALALPAVAAVVGLGTFFGLTGLIVYASIPTLAIATILERQTRARPEPPLPVARAR